MHFLSIERETEQILHSSRQDQKMLDLVEKWYTNREMSYLSDNYQKIIIYF